jgi:hypothetical protein
MRRISNLSLIVYCGWMKVKNPEGIRIKRLLICVSPVTLPVFKLGPVAIYNNNTLYWALIVDKRMRAQNS